MGGFLLRMFCFAVFATAFLEAFFRFGIPAALSPAFKSQDGYSFLIFDRSVAQRGRYTCGPFAESRSEWSINSHGWNSEQEYEPSSKRRDAMVALFGDSFVMQLLVDERDHLENRLRGHLGEGFEAYAFGSSMANMALYAELSRYAQRYFAPTTHVYFVNKGDIEGSLEDLQPIPMNYQYRLREGALVGRPGQRYAPRPIKRFVYRYSAIVRYCVHNSKLVASWNQRPTGKDAGKERDWGLWRKIADEAVREILTSAPEAVHLFVVDNDLEKIYLGNKPERRPESLVLQEVCSKRGAHLLDLTDCFWNDYREHGKRLSFESDNHWNAYGNEVVAREVGRFLNTQGLTGRGLREGERRLVSGQSNTGPTPGHHGAEDGALVTQRHSQADMGEVRLKVREDRPRTLRGRGAARPLSRTSYGPRTPEVWRVPWGTAWGVVAHGHTTPKNTGVRCAS